MRPRQLCIFLPAVRYFSKQEHQLLGAANWIFEENIEKRSELCLCLSRFLQRTLNLPTFLGNLMFDFDILNRFCLFEHQFWLIFFYSKRLVGHSKICHKSFQSSFGGLFSLWLKNV